MKKTMLTFFKPARDITKGAALQVSRTDGGVNIQLAKQKSEANIKHGKNATFDYNFNSFSAKLKNEELSKIVNYTEAIIRKRDQTEVVNMLAELTGMPNRMELKLDDISQIRLPHLNSTTKKTIVWELREYPTGSGELTARLNIFGTMGYRDPNSGQFMTKENENLSMNLKESEFMEFIAVMKASLSNQLDDGLVFCTIINQNSQDPRTKSGYKEIKEIRLPVLNVGETIVLSERLKFGIIEKGFDATEKKIVYTCVEVPNESN